MIYCQQAFHHQGRDTSPQTMQKKSLLDYFERMITLGTSDILCADF